MTSTRPPGNKTGLVTEGCYAAPLYDCDGCPTTREHYISENLLERFGESFTIQGVPWSLNPKLVGSGSLTAKILCERHNNSPSALDTMIGLFYDVLREALRGSQVGDHDYDGEDLERWAMKLMFGIAASGNVSYPGVGRVVARRIPVEHLRVLFGEAELPEGCGLKYVGAPVPGLEDPSRISYAINNSVDVDQVAVGITIKILNCFQFMTSIVGLATPVARWGDVHLLHRPGGFVLGVGERECGQVRLRWGGKLTERGLLILRYEQSFATCRI